MSFPAYESYKDGGVEWLGQVPSHWTRYPLFSLVEELADSNEGMRENNLLSLSYGQIKRKNIDDNDGLLPASFETYQIVERDDIVWRLTDLQNDQRSLRTGIVRERGIITSAYLATRPLKIWPKFLAYLLRAYDLTKVFYSMGGGLRQSMKFSDVKWLPIMLPSDNEQRAIAAFLDRETAKIDALVEAQERLIALLKEKRQAVISHAVTKGLDLSAPMKDSGVEWLGQVPAHWKVTALKRLCTLITDGAHISPETENGVYCFVSTRDVSQAGIDFDGCLRTSEASYEYLYRTGCQPEVGDVLFSKDGTIGRTVVVREQRDFVVASSLIIIRANREVLDAEFLDFLCQSDAIQDQVESFVKGAGLPRLSIANLMRVIGIFPPIHEQKLIAIALAEASVRFTALVAEAEAAVALLQERRAALISAAVTGKIDVRGLVQTAEAA